MADKDQGKSELFGEGLPGTGGDYTDSGDTEGHKRRFDDGTEVGPEMGKTTGPYRPPQTDGSDTEGHLYTGGPSTQGEFAKRAPGDNPHGER
jgi:hypothetical protein